MENRTVQDVVKTVFADRLRKLNETTADAESIRLQKLAELEKKRKHLDARRDDLEWFGKQLISSVYNKSDKNSFSQEARQALLLYPFSALGNIPYGWILISVAMAIVFKPFFAIPCYAVGFIIVFNLNKSRRRARIKNELSKIQDGMHICLTYFSNWIEGQERPYRGYSYRAMGNGQIIDWFWQVSTDLQIVGKVCVELQNEAGTSVLLYRLADMDTPAAMVWYDQGCEFINNHGGYYCDTLQQPTPEIQSLINEFREVVVLQAECESLKNKIDSLQKDIDVLALKQRKWAEIVLPPDVITYILKRMRLFDSADPAAPKGLLLYGPPGTGKTLLAKTIAETTDSFFLPLSLPDLKSANIGGSGKLVKGVWEEARRHDRTIIFIDECEGVFGRRGSVESDSFNNEIIQAFLPEWDGMAAGGNVWVIGATNRKELIDQAIVSRFGAEIEIPLPKQSERFVILRAELLKLGISTDIPEYIGQISSGMSGRDLATLARDVKTEAHPGNPNETHFRNVAERLKKRGGTAVSTSSTWETLVLPDNIKNELVEVCMALQHSETLKQQGLPVPRGVLLFGQPGTGKTEIARTMANESRLQFIAATTADLKGAWIGHSGKNVKELFDRARSSSPSIIFIDEIESVAPSRAGDNSTTDSFSRDIVTQLLQELDGISCSSADVFLIAATNHRELIDSAILSRLSKQIEIPLPDESARYNLFKIKLGAVSAAFDVELMLRKLANESVSCSGRDITSIVQAAKQRAVMRAIRNKTHDKVVLEESDFPSMSDRQETVTSTA